MSIAVEVAARTLIPNCRPETRQEIEWFLDQYTEAEYYNPDDDPAVILYDAINSAYDTAQSDGNRAVLNDLRAYLINERVYVEISDEELAQIVTTRGKKYDFQRAGKKYIFNDHPEGWKKWLTNKDEENVG